MKRVAVIGLSGTCVVVTYLHGAHTQECRIRKDIIVDNQKHYVEEHAKWDDEEASRLFDLYQIELNKQYAYTDEWWWRKIIWGPPCLHHPMSKTRKQ